MLEEWFLRERAALAAELDLPTAEAVIQLFCFGFATDRRAAIRSSVLRFWCRLYEDEGQSVPSWLRTLSARDYL
ncbi:MAG TPA: hypothetical protein VF647_25510 [Longimicrobium sp.]|jgi:hypothetical protein